MKMQFHYSARKADNHALLLTVAISKNLSSPAFEIQDGVIRNLHNILSWFQFEFVADGYVEEFESFVDCFGGDQCERKFVPDFKTSYYLIILDNYEDISDLIQLIIGLKTFNPLARFLIYVENNGTDYEDVAFNVLNEMWDNALIYTAVMSPENLDVFNLYQISIKSATSYACGSKRSLLLKDTCVNGKYKLISYLN